MLFFSHLPAVLVLTSSQIHVLRTLVNCDNPDVLCMIYEWNRPFVNHCTCLDFLTNILRTPVNCNKADALTDRCCHNPVMKHLPNNSSMLWLGIHKPHDQFSENLWESHYHNSNLLEWSTDCIIMSSYPPCYFNASKPNCMLSICAHGTITIEVCSTLDFQTVYSAYTNA